MARPTRARRRIANVRVVPVALGSDFDGALIPREIGDVRGLPRVVQALEQAGFAGEDLTAVCHGNWVRVLSDSWRPRGGS